ncbi:hypothetical protein [Microbacterium sp. 18062]|uniref:hypothetical protein n=1 Tax=Microbacterium sp. 18062 TaxID=2681410 RepID=UPI00135CB86B|nr:hypothetical protein [Microbacterium sp. 18062]
MNDDDTRDLRGLGLEPEDLDGHTIEELSDYLDRGRVPAEPSIDQSAGCRIALEALERLRSLTPELLAADTAAEPEPDEGWVRSIFAGITLDARAGRRIPIATSRPDADLGITEGAVRGLIRAAENAVPGVLIGRCRLDGDVTEPGAPIRIRIEVSVPFSIPIPRQVDRLRAEIASRIDAHTDLNVAGVDIAVHDIQQFPDLTGEDR